MSSLFSHGSHPYPFSLLLAGRALARETKDSKDKGFPVLDFMTTGLHVCSRDVYMCCVGELWRLLLPVKIFLFRMTNQ